MKQLAAGPLALIITMLFILIAKGETELRRQTNLSARLSHPYVGLWVTADHHVRHRLLPNGRYDEARGHRESAYQGRYEVHGNRILYWDDTGVTADGVFIDGVLHHGGMVLYHVE